MKKSSLKIKKQSKIAVLLLFILFICLNSVGVVSGSVLLVCTIIINGLYLAKFWNCQSMLICLVFVMTYWLYMTLYYFGGISYCTYSAFRTPEYTDATLRIASLFMSLLFYFIKPVNGKLADYLPKKNNALVYIGAVSIMLAICFFCYRAGGMFSYKEGANSTLYEYYFIFALLGYVYAGNKKRERVLLAINLLYILLLLRLGLRLVVLMVILMIFLEYFDGRFKSKWVVIGTFFGFIFMSFWSALRSGLVGGGINWNTLLGIGSNGALLTNQGDVFYTSSAQVAQVLSGKWDISQRLYCLLAFVINIILPPGNQITAGKLNDLLLETSVRVPGGGFGAMYAYVWLGYMGVVLLAIYIANEINNISNKRHKDFNTVYGVFLIFTFFRWYSYNLSIVFKMGFWLLLAYTVIKYFNNSLRTRKGIR